MCVYEFMSFYSLYIENMEHKKSWEPEVPITFYFKERKLW